MIEIGKKSSRLVYGGERITLSGSDVYTQPTIFADVAQDARIAREEIFGPMLSIQTFQTTDEAAAMANNSIYGMAASVWPRNLSQALDVSDRLPVGTVSVNTDNALSAMTPFGGIKQSGFGMDLPLHSFDKYSALKTTRIKHGYAGQPTDA